jgi:hypothetical protein
LSGSYVGEAKGYIQGALTHGSNDTTRGVGIELLDASFRSRDCELSKALVAEARAESENT